MGEDESGGQPMKRSYAALDRWGDEWRGFVGFLAEKGRIRMGVVAN